MTIWIVLLAFAPGISTTRCAGFTSRQRMRAASPGRIPVRRQNRWYSLRAGAFGPTSMACQALSHFGKSRKAMAFCAGVSMLYSTAEHGSRCGRLTSRLALLLYAARSTLQQWFADTGPLASVTSRCQSATAPGCIATSARLHWPHRGAMMRLDKVPDVIAPNVPVYPWRRTYAPNEPRIRRATFRP